MSFNRVIGQHRAKHVVQRALAHDRLPHALLLYGPAGVGKKAMAFEIAKAINCRTSDVDACDQCHACHRVATMQHPDFLVVFPIPPRRKRHDDEEPELPAQEDAQLLLEMGKDPYSPVQFSRNANISIDRVRVLRKEVSYKPYEGLRKVAVILEADRMRPAAANALLKTLEEPPGHSMLILTTAKPEALLSTILSRCQRLRMGPLAVQEIAAELQQRRGLPSQRAQAVARLADGSLGRALSMLDGDLEEFRAGAYDFLNLALFGEEIRLLETVEAWVAKRDRMRVEQLLEMLVIWLRDLLLWEQGYTEPIINFDRMNDLAKLEGLFDARGLEQSVEEVDASFEMMSRNVNLQLVLLSLAFRLRKIARRP